MLKTKTTFSYQKTYLQGVVNFNAQFIIINSKGLAFPEKRKQNSGFVILRPKNDHIIINTQY